ncbi:hypothetical protein P3X46_005902 [Hevea brasiliensis]|uniref:Di19 zinc-binding domain-containing protein n=1 Tax=Hevea brasiliensis TaxID=3981 RepID=A0ABQ9MSD0_HEVBR|nr:hypothetical protein P3X46_005902 [Hevea brasiliensis]
MASDSWSSRLLTSSRRYFSRSDLYEETDVDEDLKAEFLCPFCAEDFDVVGLYCHIDEEHPVEAKNGPLSSVEAGSVKGSTTEEFRERYTTDKDQEEKSQRCEFVQGLLLSAILDDEVYRPIEEMGFGIEE